MIFKSGKTYDTLVFIAGIVLPALAVLYTALAEIWGLAYEKEIPATIMAVDTFLGALLKISKSKYDKVDPEYLNVKEQYEDRIEAGEFDDKDYSEGD